MAAPVQLAVGWGCADACSWADGCGRWGCAWGVGVVVVVGGGGGGDIVVGIDVGSVSGVDPSVALPAKYSRAAAARNGWTTRVAAWLPSAIGVNRLRDDAAQQGVCPRTCGDEQAGVAETRERARPYFHIICVWYGCMSEPLAQPLSKIAGYLGPVVDGPAENSTDDAIVVEEAQPRRRAQVRGRHVTGTESGTG